ASTGPYTQSRAARAAAAPSPSFGEESRARRRRSSVAPIKWPLPAVPISVRSLKPPGMPAAAWGEIPCPRRPEEGFQRPRAGDPVANGSAGPSKRPLEERSGARAAAKAPHPGEAEPDEAGQGEGHRR